MTSHLSQYKVHLKKPSEANSRCSIIVPLSIPINDLTEDLYIRPPGLSPHRMELWSSVPGVVTQAQLPLFGFALLLVSAPVAALRLNYRLRAD